MKNRLAVVVALASCLFSAALPKLAWATDPGSRYSDAFVLIQQAQAAEEKSDLATAYRKYLAARDTLHAIRTDSPDWNAQMVEYRLKDCESHFDAIKAKLPNPPPASAEESRAVVTPAVMLASNEQPSAPPPVAKTATDDQAAKLQSQINTLQKENKDLKAQLAAAGKKAAPAESAELKKLRADAEKAQKSASDLEKKNADLGSQLAAAKKQAADSADAKSADLKKLRADLDKAHAEADAAKKSTARVADLQKQNKDLSAQLAAAKKEASAKVAPPVAAPKADATEVKKLRADLDAARADATQSKKDAARAIDLEKQNKDLSAQLATAKKEASVKVAPPAAAPKTDAAEVKKLRADLEAARADATQSKKDAARAIDLEKQNKDLSTKLAAAEKKASAPPVDSAEVRKLRADLDKSHAEVADLKKLAAAKPVGDSAEVKSLRSQLADARKELDQSKKSAAQVADLQKQNKDLSSQLTTAKKEASAKVTPAAAAPAVDPAELKKLRAEADSARADAEKARKTASDLEKKNADLSSKLASEKKAATTAAAAEPADARVLKQLRNENSYFRNLLDTYAAQNPELKGQLRRHDQSQTKTGQ